ncbi:sulfurtransferase TusA family protein [Demequina maris]|uniref:sulfurtransferase TusA family protein n=1 Tax=Demequina maris TaxID=1638982 RepID=UPI0007866D4B|nr:sulfurtransferase TusA family protein [Demequina maris]
MAQDDAAAGGGGRVTVDATGMLCPLPIIELAKAARGRDAGTEITVLATDLAARVDVPAWARMTGHEFVGEKKTDGPGIALTVRLR